MLFIECSFDSFVCSFIFYYFFSGSRIFFIDNLVLLGLKFKLPDKKINKTALFFRLNLCRSIFICILCIWLFINGADVDTSLVTISNEIFFFIVCCWLQSRCVFHGITQFMQCVFKRATSNQADCNNSPKDRKIEKKVIIQAQTVTQDKRWKCQRKRHEHDKIHKLNS